jgi:maltoporin
MLSKPNKGAWRTMCSSTRLSRLFVRTILAVVCSAGAVPTFAADEASEAEAIRQELQDLKHDYEQRMNALEERLRRLEASAPPAATTPSAKATPGTTVMTPSAPATSAPTPADASAVAQQQDDARAFVERAFQEDTETREYALLHSDPLYRQRMEEVLGGFVKISGYLRAGFGRSDEGGPQVGFQAPGAFSKYRLGNEAETYGELTISKDFYPSDAFKLGASPNEASPAGPIAHVQTTISVFNPYSDAINASTTDFGLPEAWASIGNVVSSQPSMKFWAGNRFYRRHDVSVTDFFFSNMSGGGGGVEDIALPFGKLALAWVGAGSTSGVSSVPTPDASNKAGFTKSNWDLRLYDVPVPGGKGEFGLVYARAASGLDANGQSAPNSDGASFMFVHTRDGVFSPDGLNKASIQFGTGAAKTLNSGFETYVLNGNAFIRPDEPDSWRFRVTEQLIANINDSFSVGPVFVYQLTDYAGDHGKVYWVSAGVRPIWHFNKYVSLAAEAGWDWVKDEKAATEGGLFKITFAPQVSLGGRFMSRPAIRAFVTYAAWSDDFVGQVGGLDYRTDNHGLTYGVQMEGWW